jgi:hypothetical protein
VGELTRLRFKIEDLRAALKGAADYPTRHLVVGIPEAIRALEVLGSDVRTVLSYISDHDKRPAHRPPDEWWALLRRSVGWLLKQADVEVTTARPRGWHPRAARLWRTLDLVSLEARGRHVNARDVNDVVRSVRSGERPGVVVSQAARETARALAAAARPAH